MEDVQVQEAEVQENGVDTPTTSENNNEPKWLPARLKRHGDKVIQDFFAELKVKDKDTLVKQLQTLEELTKEIEDLRKQNLQVENESKDKVSTEVAELNKKIEDLTSQIKQKEETANELNVRNKIVEYAGSLKALHPSDVVNFVLSNNKYNDFVLENGELNSDKIKEVVDKTKTDRPNYFKSVNPGSPSNFTGNDKPNEELIKTQTEKITNNLRKAF